MKITLVAQLLEARDLLRDCGLEREALWFWARAESLLCLDSQSPAFRWRVEELTTILFGRGSFSELPMQPVEPARLSETNATDARRRLTQEIWQSCQALLSTGWRENIELIN